MNTDTTRRPRTRSFSDRVRAGTGALFGTWVKIPAVECVELLALAGFDYVIIDLEHSPMTLRDASGLIAVANRTGIAALVRVADHAPGSMGKVLDCGAAGVVVPQVDSVHDAEVAVAACRFPPVGRRGAGATTRAGHWGLESFESYLATGSSTLIVAQLESASAIDAAGDIASVAGIDAVLFGPQDLALSLGVDASGAAVIIRDAEERLANKGLPLGIATGFDASDACDYAQRGYRLVVTSNDASILGSSARTFVQRLRQTTVTADPT